MVFKTKIVFDTNMLLAINEFKVDIFTQIREKFGNVEFGAPAQVFEELSQLSKSSKKAQIGAKIANQLIKKNKVKRLKINAKDADSALLKLSPKNIIASNDKELKKEIIRKNGRVIFLRQKKFVDIF